MNIEVVTWRGAFHREVNKKDPAMGLFYLFESLPLRARDVEIFER